MGSENCTGHSLFPLAIALLQVSGDGCCALAHSLLGCGDTSIKSTKTAFPRQAHLLMGKSRQKPEREPTSLELHPLLRTDIILVRSQVDSHVSIFIRQWASDYGRPMPILLDSDGQLAWQYSESTHLLLDLVKCCGALFGGPSWPMLGVVALCWGFWAVVK